MRTFLPVGARPRRAFVLASSNSIPSPISSAGSWGMARSRWCPARHSTHDAQSAPRSERDFPCGPERRGRAGQAGIAIDGYRAAAGRDSVRGFAHWGDALHGWPKDLSAGKPPARACPKKGRPAPWRALQAEAYPRFASCANTSPTCDRETGTGIILRFVCYSQMKPGAWSVHRYEWECVTNPIIKIAL